MNPVIRAVEPEACPTLTQVRAGGAAVCSLQCGAGCNDQAGRADVLPVSNEAILVCLFSCTPPSTPKEP